MMLFMGVIEFMTLNFLIGGHLVAKELLLRLVRMRE